MQLDDLFTLFILVVAGLSFLGRRKRRTAPRVPTPDLDVDDEFVEEVGEGLEDAPLPAPGSLGELFRQIQIEQRRRVGVAPRQASVPLPSAEEVEERETLEVVPVTRSREPMVRPPRLVVDLDDTARPAIQRRLREAAGRNRAHTAADHTAFHQSILAPPPKTTRVKGKGRTAIQKAIVWREILGPPVWNRDGGPLEY